MDKQCNTCTQTLLFRGIPAGADRAGCAQAQAQKGYAGLIERQKMNYHCGRQGY